MIDREKDVIGANTWTFARTDCEGVTTVSTFEAETWPYALQQFVNFLKGAGFGVDDESVAINGDKHLPDVAGLDYESGWYGEMFYPESGDVTDDSMSAKNDWIPWCGGACPVDDLALVRVKYKNGNVYYTPDNANGYDWDHGDGDSAIIAYQVVQGDE